jgi:threonine dehydrogenase-like Zn-dependent dehydrogenase
LARQGRHPLRHRPDPEIEDPRDAIIKVTSCAICGSDLHLFHNSSRHAARRHHGPRDDGRGRRGRQGVNGKLKKGDRVVVPFTIICGECEQCRRGNFSVCERTNRKKHLADKVFGHATAGPVRLHASHRRLSGRQAEYLRVPFADATHIKVPDGLTDEQVLFLGDIFPTGWQAAVQCDIQPTDTVAIWGCGPVGQMAIRSAILLGAEAGDRDRPLPERLEHGGGRRRDHDQLRGGERRRAAERADRRQGPGEVHRRGRHGGARHAHAARHDATIAPSRCGDDGERPPARAARDDLRLPPGGVLSIPGVYSGLVDKIPLGR